MPEYTRAPAGAFCWIEMLSSNVEASKKFYGAVFGWTFGDMPMGGGAVYSMATVGDKQIAGLMAMPPDVAKTGAPPHWLSYVAVEDVAAAAKKAQTLGGEVMMGPAEMGPGKLAVLRDPTGAVFALWQSPAQPMGTFLFGENNSLGWNELVTTNVDRAGGFYSALFGWTSEVTQMPGMTYTTFKRGDALVGGMMAQPKDLAAVGAPSTWGVYIAVADADATVASARSLGAQVFVPPTDIPTVGRFAALADPQGAYFSVIKFAPRAT